MNAADSVGLRTPLHMACRYGAAGIVTTLVRAGAAVNVRDRDGRSPLQVLCEVTGGDVEESVRSVRANVAPLLRVVLLWLSTLIGGMPHRMAADMVTEGLEGRDRAVAELLRAGATVP